MKVLVLGIGNIMFSDEGVGVHFCKFLDRKYKFKSDTHTIDFIDGGTLSNLLTPIITSYDHVIIIDCIDASDAEVGDAYFFDYEVMPNMINWSGSAHEIEMLQTLQMLEIAGDRPKTFILGVIPKRIEPMSFEISDELKKSVPVMEKQILKHLSELGFKYEQVSNTNIQDVIDELKKDLF